MKENNNYRSITTAIVYPNSRIHLGFGWECVAADWLKKGWMLCGHETRLCTGVDEHALKVQQAAEAKGLTPKAYCDGMASDIEKVLKALDIQYDRFIRTSDSDHEEVVKALVQKAWESGDIYLADYEGLYCDGCEEFKLEKELTDGKCPLHGVAPRKVQEKNYFFKLSKYQERLLALYKANPDFIQPDSRRAEILSFVEMGLRDFSISRSNFTWGIPLPFDSKQIIYVWFDALINYLTASGYLDQGKTFQSYWPASVHIIGKDITRFHAVYWPAMLMSLGIELPKRVFAHGFLNIKGSRMSKTTGNVVSPDEVMAWSGVDALRYYLLAENDFGGDGNYAPDAMVFRVNADLSNDFGNLINRSLSMTRKYFPDETLVFGDAIEEPLFKDAIASLKTLSTDLEQALNRLDTQGYLKLCLQRSRTMNLMIDQIKPWSLAKVIDQDPAAKAKLRQCLYILLEGVRFIGTGLRSVLTDAPAKIFDQLNVPMPKMQGAFSGLKFGEISYKVGAPSPIFPRLELPNIVEPV